MKNILKAKHFNSQEAWLEVWNNYREYRSRDEVEAIIAASVAEIKQVCAGRHPAYAWSGGKDSIALQIVCEDAGIQRGFCCYNGLYFTDSVNFFFRNAPAGVKLFDTGEDIEWLAAHPQFLFPRKPHIWNEQTHLKYQPIYCKQTGADLLLMGKRTQDGNFVSKDLIMSNKKGVKVYCPIREWTHEDVICAIRYRRKKLSPVYFTENGFHYGDTKFAVMGPLRGETYLDAWNRIYKIEPEKVYRSASAGIESAIRYLKARRSGKYV